MIVRRAFIAGLAVLVSTLIVAAPGSAAANAGDFVRSMAQRAINVLKDTAGGDKQKREAEFRQIFRDNFDIAAIGQFVLGIHWRNANEAQRAEYLKDLGLESSGVDKMIKAAYHMLGLMSFLTAGEKEVRAWTIPIGTKAPQAAGEIHTDIERGFIRAEIISYSDLVACGSRKAASEKGLARLEGKEYVMQDGDVVDFRFNV